MCHTASQPCVEDLRSQVGDCFRLLSDVYPVFLDALLTQLSPNVRHIDSKVAQNSRDLLLVDVNSLCMCLTLNVDWDLVSEKTIRQAHGAVDAILKLFDNLVVFHATIIHGKETHLTENYPKLVMIQGERLGDKANGSHRTISFGDQPKTHLQVCESAQRLIKAMATIIPSTRDHNFSQPSWVLEEGAHSSALWLQLLRQSERTARTFKHLNGAICNKSVPHTGYLRLADLDRTNLTDTELDLLLSICRRGDNWYRTCINFGEDHALRSMVGKLCDILHAQWRCPDSVSKPVRLRATQTGIYQSIASSSTGGAKKNTESLAITLSGVLGDESLDTAKASYKDQWHFKLNDKRKVGVQIAATMLTTFWIPFVQQRLLSADSIFISENDLQNENSTLGAYVSFSLGSRHPEGIYDTGPSYDKHRILGLATMLLELELGRRIIPGDLDRDKVTNEPCLDYAVQRELYGIEGNTDATFCQIINQCLDIDAGHSNTIHSRGGLQLQSQLFEKVVFPLVERLEFYTLPRHLDVQSTIHGGSATSRGNGTPRRSFLTENVMFPIAEMGEDSEQEVSTIQAARFPEEDASAALLTRSDSGYWLKKMDIVNQYVETLTKSNSSRKVRIAVLDTGCDLDMPCFLSLGMDVEGMKNRWRDWVAGYQNPVDKDLSKHGSKMAALLMRVAHHADIYVSRIARSQEGLSHAAGSIAEAMRHAEMDWQVDIMTLSFGFQNPVPEMDQAISDIVDKRKREGRGILFLAAANNNGLNEPEMFPASHRDVISVRGTTHTGEFVSDYSPRSAGYMEKMFFGTLGKDVPYDLAYSLQSDSDKTSGCSVATPILAGVIATFMEFAERSYPSRTDIRQALRMKKGIEAIMSELGTSTSVHGVESKYVELWRFFRSKTQEQRMALIIHALSKSGLH